MFLKELMLVKQVGQKSVIFITIGIFQLIVLSFNQVCNRCHNLLIMTMSLSDIAILNIKGSDYCCYNLISKKL